MFIPNNFTKITMLETNYDFSWIYLQESKYDILEDETILNHIQNTYVVEQVGFIGNNSVYVLLSKAGNNDEQNFNFDNITDIEYWDNLEESLEIVKFQYFNGATLDTYRII